MHFSTDAFPSRSWSPRKSTAAMDAADVRYRALATGAGGDEEDPGWDEGTIPGGGDPIRALRNELFDWVRDIHDQVHMSRVQVAEEMQQQMGALRDQIHALQGALPAAPAGPHGGGPTPPPVLAPPAPPPVGPGDGGGGGPAGPPALAPPVPAPAGPPPAAPAAPGAPAVPPVPAGPVAPALPAPALGPAAPAPVGPPPAGPGGPGVGDGGGEPGS
ncbi:large proline-rich protein BAG6-like [Heteronotia binoei]|uniref:large proline-rich protein BAG6-like n=1 Tax=Heteronotia binoei TaxID=13085 RepID=UPI00292DBA55|nr:large proline-rich protein BAG6-like [Heteronotia binoei]